MSNIVESIFSGEMTEQGLADLRRRYPTDMVVDMSDEAQFKAARKTRTECNKLTQAIDRRRLDVTKQIKEHGDSLILDVKSIYDVVVVPFEVEDSRRKEEAARVKREHEAAMHAERIQINEIRGFLTSSMGRDAEYVAGMLESVDLIDTTCFSPDNIHEAIQVKKDTIDSLSQLLADTKAREKMEAERAAMAAERAELERQKRELEEMRRARQEQAVPPQVEVIDTNTVAPEQMETPDVSADILKAAQALAHEFCDVINVDQAADIVEFISTGCVPGVVTEF